MDETTQNLEQIATAIRQRGFHAAFQRGSRLACAVAGGAWGIGGRSLWVANWDGKWFISTWTPRIYALPITAERNDIIEIVAAVLSIPSTDRLYDIPKSIQRKYLMNEITLETYTAYAEGSENTNEGRDL